MHDINRYRLRTNQFAAGKLGSTVLAIIAQIIRADPQNCFGLIATAMLNETNNARTERFRLYTRMLEFKTNPLRHYVTTNLEKSSIFILPIAVAANQLLKQATIARYKSIFRETF